MLHFFQSFVQYTSDVLTRGVTGLALFVTARFVALIFTVHLVLELHQASAHLLSAPPLFWSLPYVFLYAFSCFITTASWHFLWARYVIAPFFYPVYFYFPACSSSLSFSYSLELVSLLYDFNRQRILSSLPRWITSGKQCVCRSHIPTCDSHLCRLHPSASPAFECSDLHLLLLLYVFFCFLSLLYSTAAVFWRTRWE